MQTAISSGEVIVHDGRTLQCDGTILQKLRKLRGLSQAALAAETQRGFKKNTLHDTCSLSTIKRLEAGAGAFVTKVQAVATTLDVPIATILTAACRDGLARGIEGEFDDETDPGSGGARIGRRSASDAPSALALEEPRRARLTSVRLACEARFRKILVDDYQLVLERRMPPERYWKSFWFHQWDQFSYWKDGSLDGVTYRSWMRFRHREYRENPRLGEIDYRSGWAAFSRWLEDPDFTAFMELIFRGAIDMATRRFPTAGSDR